MTVDEMKEKFAEQAQKIGCRDDTSGHYAIALSMLCVAEALNGIKDVLADELADADAAIAELKKPSPKGMQ